MLIATRQAATADAAKGSGEEERLWPAPRFSTFPTAGSQLMTLRPRTERQKLPRL